MLFFCCHKSRNPRRGWRGSGSWLSPNSKGVWGLKSPTQRHICRQKKQIICKVVVTGNGSYCVPRGEGGYLTQQPLPMCLSRIAAVVFLYFLCATTSLKCQSQRYWQSSQWERFQTFSFFTFKVKTEVKKITKGTGDPAAAWINILYEKNRRPKTWVQESHYLYQMLRSSNFYRCRATSSFSKIK